MHVCDEEDSFQGERICFFIKRIFVGGLSPWMDPFGKDHLEGALGHLESHKWFQKCILMGLCVRLVSMDGSFLWRVVWRVLWLIWNHMSGGSGQSGGLSKSR